MDIEDLAAPLLRLKILIWVHSAIGALLLVGLPIVALATGHTGLATGSLPGLFIWCFGFAPLRKKAEELAPEDRLAPRGLPEEIPLMVGLGGLFCPFWFVGNWGGWVAIAWLIMAVTIVIRWRLSKSLDLPVHRKTWGGLLVALCIPLIFIALIGVILICSIGC